MRKITVTTCRLINVNTKDCRFVLNKIKNNYFKIECNIKNLSFAYKIVKRFKVKDSIIISALNRFKGLNHRQKIIFSNKKITCIDDSKATSFDASFQSLKSFKKIYWIVGGLPKLGDRFYFKNILKKIVKAYIIGKHTPFFVNQIKKKIPYKISKNLQSAVKDIYFDINKNNFSKNSILLSPAAASFDQFINFEDRGNKFKTLILKKFNA